MKQQFTETSEVIVTREYDIPDEDILAIWDSVEEFKDDLKKINNSDDYLDELSDEKREFIDDMSIDYEAEEIGEPFWHGAMKGNVETRWKFED